MARKPYKRTPKFGLRRVRATPELALVTLGTDTALTKDLVGTSQSSFRLISTNLSWTLTGLTGGDGPIVVGFAHSDYTVAEIKEALTAAVAIDKGDKIAQEQAGRLVRVVGTMNDGVQALNDGKPVKTRLNWLIGIGDTVKIFAWNDGTGSLTTGAFLNAMGDLWVKDSA